MKTGIEKKKLKDWYYMSLDLVINLFALFLGD